MSQDSRRKRTPVPAAAPPKIPELEVSWDDETLRLPRNPLLEDEDDGAFDRVTAIPEVPFEHLAKEKMAEVDDAEASGVHDLDQEQTPQKSEPRRHADSVPPVLGGFFQPAEAKSSPAAQPAPQSPKAADPPRIARSPQSEAQQRRAIPFPTEPTGLELDLNSTLPPMASPIEAETWSDPRDPDLELDLGSLAPPPPVQQQHDARLQPLKDRFAMGDFSGALEIAERMLSANPDDLDAQRYANRCRDTLVQMYAARLGALDKIVSVAVPSDQIRWLSLDHRAGFLLSLIDGTSSVEQLLDISGMPRLDALRILHTLLEQRVIGLHKR